MCASAALICSSPCPAHEQVLHCFIHAQCSRPRPTMSLLFPVEPPSLIYSTMMGHQVRIASSGHHAHAPHRGISDINLATPRGRQVSPQQGGYGREPSQLSVHRFPQWRPRVPLLGDEPVHTAKNGERLSSHQRGEGRLAHDAGQLSARCVAAFPQRCDCQP